MDTAFQTLLLAAGLAAPSLPPAPASQARLKSAAPVVEIARLPLASVAEAQAKGGVDKELSGRALRLSAAFDRNGEAWLKVSAGGETKAFSLSSLGAAPSASIGGVWTTLGGSGDSVTLAAGGASVSVSYGALVDALFAAARHVRPHEVLDYAVTAEDGASGVPAALCLIRRDADGVYWVTFRSPEQLRAATWFAAVNGVLKGLLVQGTDVVFVEKLIEAASLDARKGSAPSFGPEKRVP